MTERTGGTCQVSGIYRCQQHPSSTIPLAKGNTFPPCPHGGGHGATWVLVRPA